MVAHQRPHCTVPTNGGARELTELRNELAIRFEQHPHEQWSPAFLRVLRDIFDLEFGAPQVEQPRRLQVVR